MNGTESRAKLRDRITRLEAELDGQVPSVADGLAASLHEMMAIVGEPKINEYAKTPEGREMYQGHLAVWIRAQQRLEAHRDEKLNGVQGNG